MIIIILILLISIILLAIGLNIKINDIKKIKQIGYSKELNEITNKFPDNIEVCKKMLEMLNNKNVTIEENTDTRTSLYMVMSNKIIIANINDTFTRIQTIAHECIHSIQNKKILKFNFIFSNLYTLSFIIIAILTIFKLINGNTQYISLIAYMLLGFIYFVVRNYLETDAMIKAKYLAKRYMNECDILDNEEKETIINQYTDINNIGIKFYSFTIASKCILKTIILSIIMLIF